MDKIKDLLASALNLKNIPRKTKETILKLGIGFVIFHIWCMFYAVHLLVINMRYPRHGIVTRLKMAFGHMFRYPFKVFPLPPNTGGVLIWMTFLVLLTYFVIIARIFIRRHFNPDTVQGSAQWLKNLDDYNRRFTEPFGEVRKDGKNNMIFSEEMFMSMNNKAIRRNMNTLVVGGSGAGKSYNYVGPNIMQANCSYVITDPSGGLFKEYGSFLEYYGYKVKCFNLNHMDKGSHYNPFNYIHSNKDVEILVNTLIKNTTPPDQHAGDPFWEKSETALLVSIISYLYNYTDKEQQTFTNVMNLLRAAEIKEEDATSKSPLDYIFDAVEETDPESFAVKQYKTFKMGAGKTLKSILISAAVRLQAFDLVDVEELTNTDDIDLDSLGDEKSALFVIIPTGDGTFNFLAAMMYSQLFQRLYDYCENTAEFSQCIVDGEGQVVKTFRASSVKESKMKAREAEEFLERAKRSVMTYNEEFNWYELRTRNDELVLYRGDKKECLTAYRLLQVAKVVPNNKRANNGQALPIHLRMILDEFANIGKIPDFEKKVATIRKYEISVNIILQSLTQLKAMYEKNWSELTGNCDTTIYLGGGADEETAKWVSELLGKETRVVQSESYGKSGSVSMNRQGVELLAPAELRVLNEDYCIVIPKSLYAYKGLKYMTHKHPMRKLVESLDPYYFSHEKLLYLEHENLDYIDKDEITPTDVHGQVNEMSEFEQEDLVAKEHEKRQASEEKDRNLDEYGEQVVTDPNLIDNSYARNISQTVRDETSAAYLNIMDSDMADFVIFDTQAGDDFSG